MSKNPNQKPDVTPEVSATIETLGATPETGQEGKEPKEPEIGNGATPETKPGLGLRKFHKFNKPTK